MNSISSLIKISAFLFASTLFAELPSHFCLETKEGLHCDYNTEMGCEADMGPRDFCIINPQEKDVQEEKDSNLAIPDEKDPYCYGSSFGNVCLGYPQEPCNEEEKRIDADVKCDDN